MSTKAKSVNLERTITFYDPHPGMLGAAVPIPDEVKKVADDLNGKRLSLREAVHKIEAVTSGQIIVRDNCILLKTSGDGKRYLAHMWRVIKYR